MTIKRSLVPSGLYNSNVEKIELFVYITNSNYIMIGRTRKCKIKKNHSIWHGNAENKRFWFYTVKSLIAFDDEKNSTAGTFLASRPNYFFLNVLKIL